MPNIVKIKNKKNFLPVRKRVAAYARVSLETDRLNHSLSAQVSRYSELIQSIPEWEYAGVYADNGITGTIVAKRHEFLRMLSDCEAGKIDIILTKSISRFARNTIDLLNTVRRLKEIGVEVRFEKEGISTFDGTGEVMLTLLASFAQEEVESLSNNVKWGIRKGFARGDPCSRFRAYGYRWEGENMVIVPEEAEVVKRIFQNYLDGMSLLEISRSLFEDGIPAARSARWWTSTIKALLTGIIYTGDLLLQKYVISNPIDKKIKKNNGELPQYWVENHHEAIISVETFQAVQNEMERRRALGPLANKSIRKTCFTSKIKCSHCGASYMRKSHRRAAKNQDGNRYYFWSCGTNLKKAGECPMGRISEATLKMLCANAMNLDEFSDAEFSRQIEKVQVIDNGLLEFIFRSGIVKRLEWKPIRRRNCWTEEGKVRQREMTSAYQTSREGRHYPFTHRIFSEEGIPFKRVSSERSIIWRGASIGIREDVLKSIAAEVLALNEFDEAVFVDRVNRIIVSREKTLRFHLKNGSEVVRQYACQPTRWGHR